MIVDVHTHVFFPEVCQDRAGYCPRDSWFDQLYQDPRARLVTVEDLIAAMDCDGVDRAVAGGFAWSDMGLCRAHNDYLIESVRRYPDRLVGLAVVSPWAGAEAARELERCLDAGLRGLGELFPDGQSFSLDDVELLAPLARILQERGWPLLTHTSEPVGHQYQGKGRAWPWAIVSLAQAFPDLRIVGAHWGGGLPFYELMPEVAQALRNVFYDMAASPYLYRWDIVPLAVQAIGSSRILFGTDYPLLRARSYLEHLEQLSLAEVDRRAILGGNAVRLWLPELQGKAAAGKM